MAFIEDTTPISRQLKLTNYAESFEGETCYHVRRISFIITILDDVEGSAGNSFVELRKEDQEVLNWQPSPENLQDDVEVRDTLTQQSGRLCPYKNISTSLYDKVKSDDDTLRCKTGDRPLSAYEHVSFRSAMLTKHTAGDGQGERQPELLALHDGLGGGQSFLRWRSHDYIKVTLCKPRDFFTVFWLIQWDIVDLNKRRAYDDAATNQGKRRRSPSFHHGPVPRASEKFHGVRFDKKRKSKPWVAEMRWKGAGRRKIWLGNYNSNKAAARAADAGNYYYSRNHMLNFRDSPQHLRPIPLFPDEKSKEKFVNEEAHRLATMTESLSSTWDPENRTACSTSMDETFVLGNVRSGSNFSAIQSTSINSDGIPHLMISDSDLGNSFDFQSSASCGGHIVHETVGVSPERNMWPLTATSSFRAHSHGGAGVYFLPLEQPDMHQHAFSAMGGSLMKEVADTVLDDALTPWDDNIVLDIPGDIGGFESGQGAEIVQGERDGDWVGGADDIFNRRSMGQDFRYASLWCDKTSSYFLIVICLQKLQLMYSSPFY